MYYEESIIGGKLMFRTDPDGEWQECNSNVADIVNKMVLMDQEDRASIMSNFCVLCGGFKPCHCWNDE